MDNKSLKQQDAIREVLNRFGSNEGAKYTWTEWVEKHVQELNSLISEDKMHGELDGYVSPDCGCKYCVYGRKEIAKRLIDEFYEQSDYAKQIEKDYPCNVIGVLSHWLDKEGE